MAETADLGDYAAISCASALERALGGAQGGITLNAKYIEFGSGNQPLVMDARGAAVTETLAEPVGIVEILNADKPEPWQWHLAVDAKKTTDADGNIVTDFIFSEYRILDSDKNPIAIYTHETKKICAITPALSHSLFSIDWAIGLFPADSITVVHHDQNLQLWNDDVVAGIIRLGTIVEKDYLELTNADKAIKADVAKSAEELDKHKKEQANKNKKLAEDNELLMYASWAQFEYIAELNRLHFGSGLTSVRQYIFSGAEPHHQATTVNYSPNGGHSHANIWPVRDDKDVGLIGNAEAGMMINGYYARSRHIDDGPYRHADKGNDFNARVPIEPPALPADIAAQATPEGQIAQAKKYIQIMAGQLPQDAVAHYRDSARLLISGFEMYPLVYKMGDGVRDPFPGSRHFLSVNNLHELLERDQMYTIPGHKNVRENESHMAFGVRNIINGEPVVVLYMYRMISAVAGSLADYPLDDVFRYHEDIATVARTGLSREGILDSRLARFRVRQRLGQNDSLGSFHGPGLIDEFINNIPGLDGYGNTLTESYEQYGANDKLLQFDGSADLPAGYYNRWYSIARPDASGRSTAKRAFFDDSLWVAKTTDPRVMQTKTGPGQMAGTSYFIPVEMLVQTFFNSNFNPYGIPDVTNEFSGSEAANMIRNTNIGRSKDNPLPGAHNSFIHYKLPADLFDDQVPSDPADTTVSGGLWMRCADGVARKHFVAGYDYFLPTTELIGKRLRTRYPVYFDAREGSSAAKYLSATRIEMQGLASHLIDHDIRLTKLGG